MKSEATTPAPAGTFYEGALDGADRAVYAAALRVEGLDEEIGLLRMRLRGLLEENKATLPQLTRAMNALVRALAARMKLDPESEKRLEAAVRRVLDESLDLGAGHDD